jgi:hypothetical protein
MRLKINANLLIFALMMLLTTILKSAINALRPASPHSPASTT